MNINKCKVLHIGSSNSKFDYEIESRPLIKSNHEKDLGIYIQSNLKWDLQVRNCTAKANRTLGLIRKSFKYLNRDNLKLLYTSLVRPHIEYAVSSWCPYFKKDIFELEKVQRRATKLVPDLHNLNYSARLNELGLTDLKTRRIRGDLIQMYKIINNLETVKFRNGIKFSSLESRNYFLRRNSKHLHKERLSKCLPRYNFLTNRIVNDWNELPEDIIQANTLNSFKSKFDKWKKDMFETNALAQ